MEVFTASPRDRAQQRFVKQNMSTFQFLMVVESWVMVFFRPHQLGLLMRALLFVAVVWARLVLLVTMPLAVLLLVPRLVLLVTMHFVFWLLVASQFSSSSASSSLILAASGSPKDMASPSWSGAQYFEFWQNEQVWYDDVIHRVGSDVLVLKPVGRSGRAWSWMDPDFVGGPSEYRHAVRFPSPELARRFYAVWMGSG